MGQYVVSCRRHWFFGVGPTPNELERIWFLFFEVGNNNILTWNTFFVRSLQWCQRLVFSFVISFFFVSNKTTISEPTYLMENLINLKQQRGGQVRCWKAKEKCLFIFFPVEERRMRRKVCTGRRRRRGGEKRSREWREFRNYFYFFKAFR